MHARVCRPRSVGKLDAFRGRITVMPGATNDSRLIQKAVAGCHGVLTVLVPWGRHQYSSGTAQAVLDHAQRMGASAASLWAGAVVGFGWLTIWRAACRGLTWA